MPITGNDPYVHNSITQNAQGIVQNAPQQEFFGAGLLTAGLGLVGDTIGNVINNANARRTNKENQAWALKMYQMQKDDNLKQWDMTNEYNSPQAQMERLQKAGLNPNLVYGSSAVPGLASQTKIDSPPNFTRQTPQWNNGLGQASQAYFNIQSQQAGLNNLRLQNTVIAQQAIKAGLENDMLRKEIDAYNQYGDSSTKYGNRFWNSQRQATEDSIRGFFWQAIASNPQQYFKEVQEGFKNQGSNRSAFIEQQIKSMVSRDKLNWFVNELDNLGITPDSPGWQKLLLGIFKNGKSLIKAR